jgi:F0F1-type ATP synthase gamma subunit
MIEKLRTELMAERCIRTTLETIQFYSEAVDEVIGHVADAHSEQELSGLKEYQTLLVLQNGLNNLAGMLKSNLNR